MKKILIRILMIGLPSSIVTFFIIKLDTIFLTGEPGAGKTTLMNIMMKKGFTKDTRATPNAYEKRTYIYGIKRISVIDTSGSLNENTEEWRDEKKYKKICYVFDATKYYTNKRIEWAIEVLIRTKKKNTEYIAIGTRGDKIKDKLKIENEVSSKGMKCKIFELSTNPYKEVIDYIFKSKI